MKKLNVFNRKGMAIFASTFLAGILLTGSAFATELKVNTSTAYENWEKLTDEQKKYTVMPRTYDVEVPESVLSEYKVESIPHVLDQLLGNIQNPLENNVGNVNAERFNLADRMNIRVEHQQNTTECWAFSLIKAMETNIALESGSRVLKDFSERHMDYATSLEFLDGTNEAGFYRNTGSGGLLVVGLAYLTNGQGAVLESDMPFKNDETKINLSEIDKEVNTIVNDYAILPTIHKVYQLDDDGNTESVTYYKSNGETYTKSELEAARRIIKEHLATNGAIASMTGGSYKEYYNNTNPFEATAYNCNAQKLRDHAITIVGWDDNYPRENFGDGRMPSTDGAYIVLNSYGDESFDDGYIYVSYEDFFIEEEIYGISSTGNVNYDNIYQYDYYGGIYQVGVDGMTEGAFATIYTRDSSKDETIESVGITLADYADVEIYINPNNLSMAEEDLIKVGESSETLSSGYHRISITPTELTGNAFAIVVRQSTKTDRCYYQIEANVPNTAYGLVSSEGKSYISIDGNSWSNLNEFYVSNVDLETADVCIKAFTVEENGDVADPGEPEQPEEPEQPKPEEPKPEQPDEPDIVVSISSDKYTIDDKYIMNVRHNTTKEELLNNITVNTGKNVITSDGESVSDDDIIKTGMKLRLSDGTIYTLIVRGDINKDGNVSLTDISKLILHYNEVRGFELSGNELKGADMNIDGKVNLVDVSQMIVLYNSI